MEYLETKKIGEMKNDLINLMKDVASLEIGSCMQCGTCTASCPSGQRTSLATRTLLRKIQIGCDEVLSDDEIWFCSTCYKCYERCPRDVRTIDAIIYLRNLAVQKGFINPAHHRLCLTFYKTGHGVSIDDKKWSELREFYSLSRLPPTVHSHSNALKEVQFLLNKTPFKKIIEMPMNKGG